MQDNAGCNSSCRMQQCSNAICVLHLPSLVRRSAAGAPSVVVDGCRARSCRAPPASRQVPLRRPARAACMARSRKMPGPNAARAKRSRILRAPTHGTGDAIRPQHVVATQNWPCLSRVRLDGSHHRLHGDGAADRMAAQAQSQFSPPFGSARSPGEPETADRRTRITENRARRLAAASRASGLPAPLLGSQKAAGVAPRGRSTGEGENQIAEPSRRACSHSRRARSTPQRRAAGASDAYLIRHGTATDHFTLVERTMTKKSSRSE